VVWDCRWVNVKVVLAASFPLYAHKHTRCSLSSHAGTITRCHFDSYDNLLTQVWGYKYVRLYSPSCTPSLYPIRSTSREKKGEGAAASRSVEETTTLQGNISAVDVEEPNLSEHPMYAAISTKYVDTVLGPGDALYIPKGWWHYVRAISPSFTVNFWF
jgi:ribosomal protein L16 Arg81 hydroxylase